VVPRVFRVVSRWLLRRIEWLLVHCHVVQEFYIVPMVLLVTKVF